MAYMGNKHIMGVFVVFIGVFLLNAALISGLDINYTIQATVMDPNNVTLLTNHDSVAHCDMECNYSMPVFTLPEGYTITSYHLDYAPSDQYDIYFDSTKDKVTANKDDIVIVEVSQAQTPSPPAMVCNDNQCDRGCVVCSDNRCHEPGFNCVEQLAIEKITPTTVTEGVSQLNIIIRNTGSVDLGNVYVDVTGDGISTIDSTPIETLLSGDKDYSFVRINATKAGTIDVIIKMYAGNKLKRNAVTQINVIEPPQAQGTQASGVNVTELSDRLGLAKERYMDIETEYQDKKMNGYTVDLIYDKLKETHSYIINTQSYIVDGDYKKAEANIQIVEDNINDITDKLKNAKKQKVSFIDQIRNNILYISSTIAALVSILSAYTLIKGHVNRQKEKLAERLRKSREARKKAKKKIRNKKKAKKNKPMGETAPVQ